MVFYHHRGLDKQPPTLRQSTIVYVIYRKQQKKQTFERIYGLLFVLFDKKLDRVFYFSHSIFMISCLEERVLLCMFSLMLIFIIVSRAEVDSLHLSDEPFEVGGGALDFLHS